MTAPKPSGGTIRVGNPAEGGQISAGVRHRGRVWLNAASHGMGMTVDVSSTAARALARALLALADDADRMTGV